MNPDWASETPASTPVPRAKQMGSPSQSAEALDNPISQAVRPARRDEDGVCVVSACVDSSLISIYYTIKAKNLSKS